jgi:hypothetical protein
MPLPGFVSLNPGYKKEKEAERRETDVSILRATDKFTQPAQTICFGRGSALKDGARSPLGVPPRFSPGGCHLLTQLQARHPGTWQERMILWTANRGEDRARLRGRYPRPPVPVQGKHLPRRP